MTNPYMRDGTANPRPNSAALAADYADAMNALKLAGAAGPREAPCPHGCSSALKPEVSDNDA
jgi:hypothetical protein